MTSKTLRKVSKRSVDRNEIAWPTGRRKDKGSEETTKSL